MLTLTLNDLIFHARHGVLPQEGIVGGDYGLTVILTLDEAAAAPALTRDELGATVNYAEVYALIGEEMARPSALLERVATRIAARIVRTWRPVTRAEVSLTKCAPPIEGFAGGGATVTYTLERSLTVWDFDGTLADTAPGIVRTMTATFRRMGYVLPTEAAIRATIGLPLIESIERLAGVDHEEAVRAADVYRVLFEEVGTEGITLFPGVREALERRYALGHFNAVATSRGHQSADELLTVLGVRHLFSHIVACEDVKAAKPAPEPVLTLCRLTGVCPNHTEVIGDTTFDIEMGRRAGVRRTLGVTWGNHTAEALAEAGATRIVETGEELG